MPDTKKEPPFEAYRGDEPYLFVSYAHVNANRVFPHLNYLRRRGYRIWFDEGIDPGNEWSADIENALTSASAFIVFITPQSVASRNVNREINFALNLNVPFFAIHLSRTSLTPGLELQIGRKQALMPYHMKGLSYARQIGRMLSNDLVDPTVNQALAGNPPVGKSPRWLRPAAILLGLLILLGGAVWLSPKVFSSHDSPDPPAEMRGTVQVPELRWNTEARDFLEFILNTGWDSGIGRLIYGDIVLAGEQGKRTELLVDGRFTRNGHFYRINIDESGRWTSEDLPKDEAFRAWKEFKNYHRRVEGSELKIPRFELAELSNPQLKVEKRGEQLFLSGRVFAKRLADVELRSPILMIQSETGFDGEKTRVITQLVPLHEDIVPDGTIEIETELTPLQNGEERDWSTGVTLFVESFALMGNPKTYVVTNRLTASVDQGE